MARETVWSQIYPPALHTHTHLLPWASDCGYPCPPGLGGVYTTFFPEKDLVRALVSSLVMNEASASSMLMPWGSKMSALI